MKSLLVIFTVFLLWPICLGAQKSIRIYTGFNISNTTYKSTNSQTNNDSISVRQEYYVLPNVGIDIDVPFSKKTVFTTGMGVSIMGQKKYIEYIPPGQSLDPDLRLNYIRIPLLFKYKIFDNLIVFAGYSFNYCYRKNINLFVLDENNGLANVFNPFHHGAIFGITGTLGNLDLSLNIHKGLNHIWDTGNIYNDKRNSLSLNGIQISIGYHLSD